MTNHPQQLRNIAEQIRDIDQQREQLHAQRAQAIQNAKQDGLRNREIAQLLGVYETHIYRMSKNTNKGDDHD